MTLENVFITALEGGSNYWYFLPKEAMDIVDQLVPSDKLKSGSERIFEAVFDKGGVIPIHDAEDEETKIGELNLFTFTERLQKCAEDAAWAICNEIDETGDATSSDVIFQYLCLGEQIYS
jgi:hypothetical protein